MGLWLGSSLTAFGMQTDPSTGPSSAVEAAGDIGFQARASDRSATPSEIATAGFFVALASFNSAVNAQRYLTTPPQALPSDLVAQLRALSAANGLHRVVVGPFAGEREARDALARARAGGLSDAWFLRGTPVEVSSAARAASAPDERVAVVPTLAIASAPADTRSRTELPSTPALNAPQMTQQGSAAASTGRGALPAQLELVSADTEVLRLQRLPADARITVDGHIDEAVWSRIPAINDFVVIEPDTLQPGAHETRMQVTYSDEGLYVAARNFQPAQTLVQRLSGRDVRDNRDSFSITLDTSGEGRYGFWFGVNLGDSLMDGTVLPERTFSSDWDGPWYGRSRALADGWSVEFFIPWGIVSMPAADEVRRIGMYVSRKVAYLDERWAWPALAPTQSKFMSALSQIEMRDVKPRQQYNVYPFVATAYDWVDGEPRYRAGVDAFWRPSSNFQINATLNPDFGNVESDDVIINLTATETFFPEKRLFFLEGQEIFVASPRADTRGRGVGNAGLPYTMVNTRRIGGRPRAPSVGPGVEVPQRELVQPTELQGAFKTTGQLGRLRYGFMGAFEEDVKFDVLDNGVDINLGQPGNDYGVARLLYEDSEGEGYKAVGVLSTAVLNEAGDAVAHGVDLHYLSPRGGVKIDSQIMTSDIDGIEQGYGGFLDFEFTYRQGLKHRVGLEYFDEHIDINDLGFLQRNDEYRIRSALQWTKSDLGWARENQFDVRGFLQKNISESLFTGGGIFFSNRTNLNDLSQVVARVNFFAPVYDDLNSFGNGTYRVEERVVGDFSWESDTTQAWSVRTGLVYAEEHLGAPSYTGSLGVTWRPHDRFSLEASAAYTQSDGWLLHQGADLMATFDTEQWIPRLSLEYYFSARQQIRLAVQWVGIRAVEKDFFRIPGAPGDLLPITKPVGAGFRDDYSFAVSQYAIQARYRWEIAPLSDVFLVYTRQADLRTALGEAGFTDIFDDAIRDPLADVFVLKVRYRFGS
ncbi:MAG: DUF5916 domain-containing protein [Pseudomonadota bacterium]